MKKTVFLVSMCIVLLGCGSYAIKDGKKISLTEPTAEGYTQILEGWENASESHLIERWGVPTQTYEVNGKKYLLYKEENYLTLNGNSYHFYCDTTFTVENGKIESLGPTSHVRSHAAFLHSEKAGSGGCMEIQPFAEGLYEPWIFGDMGKEAKLHLAVIRRYESIVRSRHKGLSDLPSGLGLYGDILQIGVRG